MESMIEYGKKLFRDNPTYRAYIFNSRSDWMQGRKSLNGIGGSDSAAALGLSKWRTNLDLWKIKTGRMEQPDISEEPAVRYGTLAEEQIRRLYQLDTEDKYEVNYLPDIVLKSNQHPCMLYSPDGLLFEKATGRTGVLEIKTSTIHGNGLQWKDQIPQNYYIQILHGMAVTGADFTELRAWLRYSDEYTAVRTYHVERDDVAEDIEYVIDGVENFWKFVAEDKEPPLIIGGLGE